MEASVGDLLLIIGEQFVQLRLADEEIERLNKLVVELSEPTTTDNVTDLMKEAN